MFRLSEPVTVAATKGNAACGSDDLSTAVRGSESWLWFSNAAQSLLGKDAGLHLHRITGYPERSCYYYASGERAPPVDFLRKLFHSAQGEPFFLAFMSGCDARWWREHQGVRRSADTLAGKLARIVEITEME